MKGCGANKKGKCTDGSKWVVAKRCARAFSAQITHSQYSSCVDMARKTACGEFASQLTEEMTMVKSSSKKKGKKKGKSKGKCPPQYNRVKTSKLRKIWAKFGGL